MIRRYAASSGFTMVELIVVMVIIGILAAYAAPRFVDRTGFESRGLYDQAQGMVRYAQKIAIAQRQSPPKPPVYIVITATQLRVCYDAACVTPVNDPNNDTPLALTTPGSGLITLSPVTTFSFDGSGAPSIGSQLTISVNSTGVGDINRDFFVEPTTGYVHQ